MTAADIHLARQLRELEACIKFYQNHSTMQLTHDCKAKGKRTIWLTEPAGPQYKGGQA